MKKEIKTEVAVCDFCGKSQCVFHHCLGCGKDICYDCMKSGCGNEYYHSVYCSGSGDGTYCKKCDARLSKSGDKLLVAYQAIARLRSELEVFNADFDERRKRAEEALKKLTN